MTSSEQAKTASVKASGRLRVQGFGWIGWLPLLTLPTTAVAYRNSLLPWVFMWVLSIAIFFSLKWLTWWRTPGRMAYPGWRSMAYLLAWPGMDAEEFLDARERAESPLPAEWLWAACETALGALLLWAGARSLPRSEPLLRGWVGMAGLILLLHFGTFQFVALIWQTAGVNAKPIMSSPLRATSLAEFWGKRWNLGFRQLGHDLIFRPLHRIVGAGVAGFLVFLVSGLIHDLVISVPSRGGYGLPTAYFLLQSAGITAEHSRMGRQFGLGRGARGWMFTVIFVSAPAFWLFHPWFVLRVVLPFMKAIRAL